MTLDTTANKLAGMFTTRTRTNGDRYWLLIDGAPDLLADTVRDLHGDHMPNDIVHELCADVWAAVWEHARHDTDPTDPDTHHAIADDLTGGAWCYYSDRSRWFDGDPMARDACEQWREDYGGNGSVDDMIGGGLYVRLYGIAAALGDTYAELVADDTDDTDETVTCLECGGPVDAGDGVAVDGIGAFCGGFYGNGCGEKYANGTATDGGTVCEEHGQPIPATVTTGYSNLTDTYHAACDACGRVFIGWECLCEWSHDCPAGEQ